MALKLVPTSQFKRDYKRMKKRGLNMAELQIVLDKLCADKPLEERHRDHALVGRYAGFRECHIRPDWLLVYAIDKDRLILVASRTGTHSDLFDE
ncbi:type II toxin-antitoxin system YafQ family toxin [Enorma massiliensis]|uniref:type II toxin-antitoxin system YafQ family toxin n=1 Tax=Enorma massiliensis TaxID=1472761 RepID=UPI00195A64D9|nr:type II toxin-antitoxin system YafQ family toxin [Enorma massiliensis]MBM6783115.1 type II toxin-antitoxin system YafQ family toxin [Enorma massiliensis]